MKKSQSLTSIIDLDFYHPSGSNTSILSSLSNKLFRRNNFDVPLWRVERVEVPTLRFPVQMVKSVLRFPLQRVDKAEVLTLRSILYRVEVITPCRGQRRRRYSLEVHLVESGGGGGTNLEVHLLESGGGGGHRSFNIRSMVEVLTLRSILQRVEGVEPEVLTLRSILQRVEGVEVLTLRSTLLMVESSQERAVGTSFTLSSWQYLPDPKYFSWGFEPLNQVYIFYS